jgi:perosamine synthetase
MKDAFDLDLFRRRLREALPAEQGPYPLHAPEFGGRERELVSDCINTGWVSSGGAQVAAFENRIAAFTGISQAVATVNGTAALHLCLRLAGVGQGEEVILPALTFVATANAVAYCHAVPHFADCETTTLGLNPEALREFLVKHAEVREAGCFNKETGRRVAAVIVVHAFGHPADMLELAAICERWKLPLIEDAAESLGSRREGKHTGSWGVFTALSFNGNKIVTTGGGGAILTGDARRAAEARHLSTTAKVPHAWEFMHDRVGYNYRLPNLNAALGCAQLEQLDGFIERKRRLFELYTALFKELEGAVVFQEPPGARSNYWLNILLLDKPDEKLRDSILETTLRMQIHTRPAWRPLHRLPMFADCPRMPLPVTESLANRIINLPSSPRLVAVWGGGQP